MEVVETDAEMAAEGVASDERFAAGKRAATASETWKIAGGKSVKVIEQTKYTINDCLNASSDQTDCGLFIKNFEKLLQKLRKEYPKGQFFIKEESWGYDGETSYNIYMEREETKEEKTKRLDRIKKEKQKKVEKTKKKCVKALQNLNKVLDKNEAKMYTPWNMFGDNSRLNYVISGIHTFVSPMPIIKDY